MGEPSEGREQRRMEPAGGEVQPQLSAFTKPQEPSLQMKPRLQTSFLCLSEGPLAVTQASRGVWPQADAQGTAPKQGLSPAKEC